MSPTLTSAAFAHQGAIPTKYTCEGADVSPPLTWIDLPPGTKSLALIVDDPDAPDPAAPKMTWVHWVLYNLPAETRELPEGVPKEMELKDGSRQGRNDFARPGYGGPCPPRGAPHRYYFKLFALDTRLNLAPGATKADLEKAMKGHILGQAELVGTYQKRR